MSNPLLKRAASSRGLDSTKGPFGILFGPSKKYGPSRQRQRRGCVRVISEELATVPIYKNN
jgi:hypothetical protein